ncbi:hypothetical protein ACLOJK_003627 [Asimina triloba]
MEPEKELLSAALSPNVRPTKQQSISTHLQIMVAAASAISTAHSHPKTPLHHQNPPTPNRTPLLPSEFDNGGAGRHPPARPNSRFVASRYMSSSSSSSSSSGRRFPSPLVSRTAAAAATPSQPSVPKRAQSVERRRPTTPLPDSRNGNAAAAAVAESLAAAKVLRTSCRSLSVSFQGESFSLPISKVKAVPASTPLPQPNSRKLTPERRRTGAGAATAPVRRDQAENSKPAEQQRWPARNRHVDPLSRSLDFGNDRKVGVGGFGSAVRATLQQSMIDDGPRASFDGLLRSHPDSCNADLDNGSPVASDLTASDTDSVSSGSNSGMPEFIGIAQGRATPRGIHTPARFLNEASSHLRPSAEPNLPLSTMVSQPKPIPPKKGVMDSSLMSPRMTSRPLSSPLRSSARAPSPSKLHPSSPSTSVSSPARGMGNPLWMRNSSVISQMSNNTPSVLSFAADVRRWKIGENRIEDAHLLRLLYNRLLQWRFINARADAAIFIQRLTAESADGLSLFLRSGALDGEGWRLEVHCLNGKAAKCFRLMLWLTSLMQVKHDAVVMLTTLKILYSAWEATSELRDSVTAKRIHLQLLRQHSKLSAILKPQMSYLEEWALLDTDHSNSLSGAIEALKASTLRLPVIGGAKADIQRMKDAICSAVDVMQATGSTICPLLAKLEGMNSLAVELANVTALEQAVMEQCKRLLSSIAAMQRSGVWALGSGLNANGLIALGSGMNANGLSTGGLGRYIGCGLFSLRWALGFAVVCLLVVWRTGLGGTWAARMFSLWWAATELSLAWPNSVNGEGGGQKVGVDIHVQLRGGVGLPRDVHVISLLMSYLLTQL